MRLISAEEVFQLLPMPDAIALMREAFMTISTASASLAHRQALPMTSGTGLLMGAAKEGLGLGCKLVAIAPGNRARGLPGSIGLVVLLDDQTGAPLALIDGTSLTSLRTAALNGFATDLLARRNARRALLVGCGTQAAAQAEALVVVRDLEELRVLGRDPVRARAFAEQVGDRLQVPVRLTSDLAEALDSVELITAATNALEPVVPGSHIPAGCHVSGIGSFRPDMREFDEVLLGKAGIFVESRETALSEAGELIAADRDGVTRAGDWAEIGEVIAGSRRGRTNAEQITFFKSVGHSVFDLYTARALYDAAMANGAGQEWVP